MRIRPFMLALLPLAAIAIGFDNHAVGRGPAPSWPQVQHEITVQFPGIASVTTQELTDWLADPHRSQPLLLDVRAREEFEVSHLPNAIWAATAQQQSNALLHVSPSRTVVLYCSVGWRSAQATSRLLKGGRRGVFNLEGSIFQWANEGRPLTDSRVMPVHVVHPFNREWGSLLDRHLWSHDPSS